MDKPNNIPVAPLTCLELFCQNVRMQIVICCFHPSLNWIHRTARPYLRQRFSRLPAFMEPWCPNSFHPIPALFGGLFSLVIFVFMRAHSFLNNFVRSRRRHPSHSKIAYLHAGHRKIGDGHVKVPALIWTIQETCCQTMHCTAWDWSFVIEREIDLKSIWAKHVVYCDLPPRKLRMKVLPTTRPTHWQNSIKNWIGFGLKFR